ncbi:MAG: hypothetical protein HYR86_04815 [Candidatus Rokubacteria bacterium]|nr:hypothetical protein [Candidatus Rokubacteria bacterium]
MARHQGLRGRRAWLLAVFLPVVLAVLVQAGSIPHSHSASLPGIYNGDHNLQSQATVGASSAMLSTPPALIADAPALVLRVPDAPDTASALGLGTADPRAPPAR